VQLELDESFFQVRIGRASQIEIAYLSAMADASTNVICRAYRRCHDTGDGTTIDSDLACADGQGG
jgi:hypothetical protein